MESTKNASTKSTDHIITKLDPRSDSQSETSGKIVGVDHTQFTSRQTRSNPVLKFPPDSTSIRTWSEVLVYIDEHGMNHTRNVGIDNAILQGLIVWIIQNCSSIDELYRISSELPKLGWYQSRNVCEYSRNAWRESIKSQFETLGVSPNSDTKQISVADHSTISSPTIGEELQELMKLMNDMNPDIADANLSILSESMNKLIISISSWRLFNDFLKSLNAKMLELSVHQRMIFYKTSNPAIVEKTIRFVNACKTKNQLEQIVNKLKNTECFSLLSSSQLGSISLAIKDKETAISSLWYQCLIGSTVSLGALLKRNLESEKIQEIIAIINENSVKLPDSAKHAFREYLSAPNGKTKRDLVIAIHPNRFIGTDIEGVMHSIASRVGGLNL